MDRNGGHCGKWCIYNSEVIIVGNIYYIGKIIVGSCIEFSRFPKKHPFWPLFTTEIVLTHKPKNVGEQKFDHMRPSAQYYISEKLAVITNNLTDEFFTL